MGKREWYRSISKGEKEIPGCMNGMLHFFDFHRILFTPSGDSSGSGRAAQVTSADQQLHRYPSHRNGKKFHCFFFIVKQKGMVILIAVMMYFIRCGGAKE